jgi:hypothetical protein
MGALLISQLSVVLMEAVLRTVRLAQLPSLALIMKPFARTELDVQSSVVAPQATKVVLLHNPMAANKRVISDATTDCASLLIIVLGEHQRLLPTSTSFQVLQDQICALWPNHSDVPMDCVLFQQLVVLCTLFPKLLLVPRVLLFSVQMAFV